MTYNDWLPAVSIPALISLAVFLARNLILTRLKASVEHEFNAKLETLRADLRNSEESFKADLHTKEIQIEVLRTGALSGLASRQAVLDKRRLEAVEQLWEGVEKLAPLKPASSMMNCIDFTKSLRKTSQDHKAREVFSEIGKLFDLKKIDKLHAHKARPFVSEMAWALFSAYRAILYYAGMQVEILKLGGDADVLEPNNIPKLLKVALPQFADYTDKFGAPGYNNLLEPLEAELLKELQRMMRGEESDKASVEQAAKIMKEAAIIDEAISKGSATATAT